MTRPDSTHLFIQVCVVAWTQTAAAQSIHKYVAHHPADDDDDVPTTTPSGTWHYRYCDFYNSTVQLNVLGKIVTRLLSLGESTTAAAATTAISVGRSVGLCPQST